MTHGVENVVSEIPTQYLCNMAYFNALHKFEGKAMFIHIPSLKNMSEDMMDRIAKCMEEMANEYRDHNCGELNIKNVSIRLRYRQLIC